MKSIKTILFSGGLAGALFVLAGFMNLHTKKVIKNLQTMGNSTGFAVVELFTSEGCSSCPPADELVDKIERDSKNSQIYILAFHVDYWDHQGWKDRFSDHEYSKRQGQYAGWLNLQSVYTPQIVVNGAKEYVGSNQGPILKAISEGLEQESGSTLTLNGKIEHDQVAVEYQVAGDEKKSELVLALIQKSAQSSVKGGENVGLTLSHVQIVRQLLRSPIETNGKKSVALKLPADFTAKGWELIGFVQHKTDGRITAAARFDLQSI